MPPEKHQESSGKLKIFLGYAAGVGKTYRMLEEAQILNRQGVDVVVGCLEAHGRRPNLGSLEQIPTEESHYADPEGGELNVRAVLNRRPAVCVVDSLSHRNPIAAERHARWEDVLSILAGGIDVLTTLDVANIETLNDEVWYITGVRVRDTVPDWVVNQASEMIMVDVTPRALLKRLERGEIYPTEEAERARDTFLNEPALAALRELALRQTAHALEFHHSSVSQGSAEADHLRILVHISDDPSSAVLLRRGKRIADFFDASCIAVCVYGEPTLSDVPKAKREAIERHLRFASTMHIETRVVHAENSADALLEVARSEEVTQIIVARGHEQPARGWFAQPTFLDRLIRNARDFQVTVVADVRRDGKVAAPYAEDTASALMTDRYAHLAPEETVENAISHMRKQAELVEMIYYAYVLSPTRELLGVISFRELLSAPRTKEVQDVMQRAFASVSEDTDKQDVARIFESRHLLAVPVLDSRNRLRGIISVGDLVDLVKQEAGEDIQKLGGMEALDGPYLQVRFKEMIQKRAGWLAVLFFGEMLTATAMGVFADEIAKAVVLALFLPLIISSGGNSGSQATTLVIQAMALGQVRLHDWWKVIRRELASGVVLGTILGVIGVARILVWHAVSGSYGPHYGLVAATIGASLVGVVTFGTIAGSMLPFILRACGLDPASASAPFVATLVDVSGLIIYFTIAKAVLRGSLLG